MNSPARHIATLLEASSVGLGLALGTDLFIAEELDSPDSIVTVYNTGGFAPQSNYEYLKPTVQVRVRGAKNTSSETSYTTAENIIDALHGVYEQTVSGTRYVQILALGDIFSLGKDENNRFIYTVNFEIHRVTA